MLPRRPNCTLFPYTTLFRSKSLRERMGLVTQETFLFHDTIFNNIQFGRLGATPEEIYEAAKAAYAHEFIMARSEDHTSELQSHSDLVCRLLLEKKKINSNPI